MCRRGWDEVVACAQDTKEDKDLEEFLIVAKEGIFELEHSGCVAVKMSYMAALEKLSSMVPAPDKGVRHHVEEMFKTALRGSNTNFNGLVMLTGSEALEGTQTGLCKLF